MSSRRLRLSTILVVLAAGCGSSSRIEVQVRKEGCSVSCLLGQLITLYAYRANPPSACVIESDAVVVSEQHASLENLPLVEGESFSLGAVTTCIENPLCPVCWAAKTVTATAGTRHELSLTEAAGCTPGDPGLALITKLPRGCP